MAPRRKLGRVLLYEDSEICTSDRRSRSSLDANDLGLHGGYASAQSQAQARPKDAEDADTPLRVKRRRISAPDVESSRGRHGEPEQQGQELSKRSGKKRTKGKTGRLAFILDAPTEIVLEILAYLAPLDILHLSYVDKQLRAMLTAPEAKSIWIAARQNLAGFPDCPPDFTEAGYARFVFLKKCEMCGGIAHGLSEMPYIRIRLCGKCRKAHCVNGVKAADLMGLFDQWVELLPRDVPYGNDMAYMQTNTFFKPAVERLVHKIVPMTDGEFLSYRGPRTDFIAKVTEHATQLNHWLINARHEEQRVADVVRERRLQAIRRKFEELGHDSLDMCSQEFLNHRVVSQPVDLTDRSWVTVRRHMEPIVERNKITRLEIDKESRKNQWFKDRFIEMWSELPEGLEKKTFIPILDFLALPPVEHLIKEADIDVEDLPEMYDVLLPDLRLDIEAFMAKMRLDLVRNWRTMYMRYLRREGIETYEELPPSELDDDADQLEFLQRATTVFYTWSCRGGCDEPVHYETMFDHMHSMGTAQDTHPNLAMKWSTYSSQMRFRDVEFTAMTAVVESVPPELIGTGATVPDLDELSDRVWEGDGWRASYRKFVAASELQGTWDNEMLDMLGLDAWLFGQAFHSDMSEDEEDVYWY